MAFLYGLLPWRKNASPADRQRETSLLRRTAPRRLGIMALEPRMMYDAAGVATVAAVATTKGVAADAATINSASANTAMME